MTEQLQTIRKYGMTEQLDQLYANSRNGDNAKRLYEQIVSEPNLLMAIHNVKMSRGAKVAGVDGKTIDWYLSQPLEDVIDRLRSRLVDYSPEPVVRCGKIRDGRRAGVVTVEDRIIQQAMKQILEPWCEARFHPHSYGFRPLRGAHHALSRAVSLVNVGKMYYVVKLDMESFFDNVPHDKLNKALWNIGIHDKRVLSILNKMLKSPIVDEGVMDKGLVPGGVISPLLSNILLNQLDWWVSTQWEDFPTKDKRYLHRKKTNLKSGYLVRYVDDVIIMCRSYEHAIRWYYAAVKWLSEFLGIQVDDQKSSVVNLKRKHVDFVGFSIKASQKGTARYGYVAETHISTSNKIRIQSELRAAITRIQYGSHNGKASTQYNLKVMGIKRYFRYATHVYLDLDDVAQSTFRTLKVRLRDRRRLVPFRTLDKEYKSHHPGVRERLKSQLLRGCRYMQYRPCTTKTQ